MKLLPTITEGLGLTPFRRQMDRLFCDFFPGEPNGFPALAEGALLVDLAETPESVVVKAEVPGIELKDLDISIVGETLYIRGEKKEEKEEKGKTWHRVERSYGAFARAVTLPSPVKQDKIEATAKDGVLTITLPKAEEAKAHKIVIKGS